MKRYVIETQALKTNIDIIKKKAGGVPVFAVVKGNGYGLGLCPFAKLLKQQGITHFAVTEPEDALALRDMGLQHEEILLLRPITGQEELRTLIEADILLTIASEGDAVAAAGVAEKLDAVAGVHIKIDTGMGRYGFLPDETDKIESIFKYMQRLAVCGVYTHFHSAFLSPHATEEQYDTFKKAVAALSDRGYDPGTVHCANTSALLLHPDMLEGACRVGSGFLGRLSFKGNAGLTKIGYCEASIEGVRWLPKGSTVGYGAAYKCRKATRIAVIPVGWYNGFGVETGRDVWRWRDCIRYALSAMKSAVFRKALYVTLNGKKCRVLGHVGMLNIVIDVSKVACAAGDVARLEISPLHVKGMDTQWRD